MDPIGDASLSAMASAASLQDVAGLFVLKQAIDTNAQTMTALLESLPQKDNAGTVFDTRV